jgi:hypothetical protein
MKKTLRLILILSSITLSAQYNPNAPWMKALGTKNGTATLSEMKASFDEYWKTHDKNRRGCGYKPFMRWMNYWENLTNDDGSLLSSHQLQQALNQRKVPQFNRNISNINVSNWQPVGPFAFLNTGSWSSGKGRVQTVVEDPNNPNIIYIGTPASGLWKSTDAGINFTNISDNLPQNGVSGIAIDPNNSNIIYIATGDSDGGDTESVGVLKTTDGGATWNPTGLVFSGTSKARDIIINPINSQMLWCGTSDGIYKTTDGGTNWTNTQTGDFSQGAIRLKPTNPNIVYASGFDGFFRSADAGNSFTNITSGTPTATGNRALVDVSAANPNVVYLLSAESSSLSVYKSTDSGLTFVNTGVTNVNQTYQVWYDMAFAVSQTNADEFYAGTLNIWKSTDGGITSTQLNSWSAPQTANYTHADIHYLKFFGTKLYCGSDGGIYRSNNQGLNFTDLTASAQIGQFYKIAVSKQSAGKMAGGLQDNGGYGYSNSIWKNFYGADGMDTAIDPNNSNLYYGFIQNGTSLYVSSDAANSSGSSVPSPNAETGNWVTPLAVNSAGEVFSGFRNLYKLNASAWGQQNTANVGTGNIDVLTIDPSNDNNIWIAKNNLLYKSTNKGLSFTNVYTNLRFITSICVNASNSSIIYIVTTGTNGQVLKSINGGSSFTDIGAGLPTIGKSCIKHQGRNTNNPLFLGTSLGVYYLDDTLSSWIPLNTNLPNVYITDLEINLEDAKIIAATYGRGIWQSSIAVQIPTTDLKVNQVIQPTTTVGCSAITPIIEVKNNGTSAISTIAVNYTINTTPYSYNWTGNLAAAQTVNISLPTLNLPRGNYNLMVNATTTNDAYSDNNNLTTKFYINNSGTIGAANPFETPATDLLTYSEGISDGWIRGIRSGSALDTGTNSVYATNLSGNYTDGKKAYLVSQCYDLTSISNPEIRFKMAYDLETNYDIIYTQYSTDGGTNWNILGTQSTNWYNSNRTPINMAGDCQNCPGAQWTGTNTTMTEYFYPLNTLASSNNIIFRIVFNSDDGTGGLGVIVDDFVINGSLATENFDIKNIAIYPNPSTRIFNIGIGNSILKTIEVTDITGKTILKQTDFQSNNSEIPLNLSHVSNGVYFVKIATDEAFIIKKIIKN